MRMEAQPVQDEALENLRRFWVSGHMGSTIGTGQRKGCVRWKRRMSQGWVLTLDPRPTQVSMPIDFKKK